MGSAQQYIDLFSQCRDMICNHSFALMNSKRDSAFDTFRNKGFPTRKEERMLRVCSLQTMDSTSTGLTFPSIHTMLSSVMCPI